MEGTVRLKGHIEHTSPPSDISSIDGNEENERNCHTPSSMSSNENKVTLTKLFRPDQSDFVVSSLNMLFKENRQPKPVEISASDASHSDASELLKQVENALDKVSGIEHTKTASFTGRLIGTLTRTVKYVTDVSTFNILNNFI